MKVKKPLDIAFIGTGDVAVQHMHYLRGFENVRIAGLYDINPKILAKSQGQFGGVAYGSIEQMLDTLNPDAVFICIPPYAHGEPESHCISRRIPFFVEKPIAKDIETAKKISELVRNSDLLTSVGYMNRYRKGVQKTKDLLKKYPVTMIHGGWFIDNPMYDNPWLTQNELSGGQLVEQTTHIFDLIRFLCSEASTVHSYGTRGINPVSDLYDTHDATGVLIKMKNGAFASVLSSWSSGFYRGIHLALSGPFINILFNNWELDTEIQTRETETPIYLPGETNIFAIEDKIFLDAVRENDRSGILSDYTDGLKSLAVSIAAIESLKSNKPVSLVEILGE